MFLKTIKKDLEKSSKKVSRAIARKTKKLTKLQNKLDAINAKLEEKKLQKRLSRGEEIPETSGVSAEVTYGNKMVEINYLDEPNPMPSVAASVDYSGSELDELEQALAEIKLKNENNESSIVFEDTEESVQDAEETVKEEPEEEILDSVEADENEEIIEENNENKAEDESGEIEPPAVEIGFPSTDYYSNFFDDSDNDDLFVGGLKPAAANIEEEENSEPETLAVKPIINVLGKPAQQIEQKPYDSTPVEAAPTQPVVQPAIVPAEGITFAGQPVFILAPGFDHNFFKMNQIVSQSAEAQKSVEELTPKRTVASKAAKKPAGANKPKTKRQPILFTPVDRDLQQERLDFDKRISQIKELNKDTNE